MKFYTGTRGNPQGLDGNRITIKDGDRTVFEVVINGDAIEVRGLNPLAIEPQVSNLITIKERQT